MIERVDVPGLEKFSQARAFGSLLRQTLEQDPHFCLFSPDETTSNLLDAAYDASARAWNLPTKAWDLALAPDGRVVELLSENTLFAAMLGHILSGEQAMMASYEAFFPIITSQLLQHLKFLQQSSEVDWRPSCPAVNLLSTSTCWRQDHNGFSHQSPMLISTLLDRPGHYANCLFPVDDVAAEAAYNFMLQSTNVVNLTTFNKTEEPRWIDSRHAEFQYINGGASIYEFASTKTIEGFLAEPDFVFTAAGDIATKETLLALDILAKDLPQVKVRFIGITALTHGAIGTHQAQLDQLTFDDYFTTQAPIIANFHGYPATLRDILECYTDPLRLSVHGFSEQGSTTTPFEMLSLNQASRYHLCIDVAAKLGREDLVAKYRAVLALNQNYARSHGVDLPEIAKKTY